MGRIHITDSVGLNAWMPHETEGRVVFLNIIRWLSDIELPDEQMRLYAYAEKTGKYACMQNTQEYAPMHRIGIFVKW